MAPLRGQKSLRALHTQIEAIIARWLLATYPFKNIAKVSFLYQTPDIVNGAA